MYIRYEFGKTIVEGELIEKGIGGMGVFHITKRKEVEDGYFKSIHERVKFVIDYMKKCEIKKEDLKFYIPNK